MNKVKPSFSVIKIVHDGKPLVAAIDMAYADFSYKDQYPWFLSISIPLNSKERSGLPTSKENKELDIFEDAAEKRVKEISKCVFIGRVTWNGHRELLYYVSDP